MEASILVALGDAVAAEKIAASLRTFGHHVTGTARSGAETLRAVAIERPSLVLIDARLGGDHEGVATAAELREKFGVPVVYMTSFPDDATLALTKATLPYGYLIEPFTDNELRSAIDVALHKRELEKRLDTPLTDVISNMSAATDRIEGLRAHLDDRGATERAAMEAELSELGDILREASEGAERVRGIVHELHRFAGARSRDATLVDLPTVLDLAVRANDAAVLTRAQIHRDYGTTPFVHANEGELTQLFTNLLANAADSIDEGSPEKNTVRIVTFTDDTGRAVVEVRDTGHVRSATELAHAFDRSTTTRPLGEDRGLGLSICRGIVISLRGEINMESTPDDGNCVRVVFPPTRPAQRARASLRAGATTAAMRRGRILIVDDEPAVARSTARVLTRDHDVFVENEGARALERLLSDETFDVVLCDLAMPGMSGADLYETIAATRPELISRFVFLTGGAFSTEARAFLDSLPNVSLQKPFSIESLRKILRDYVL